MIRTTRDTCKLIDGQERSFRRCSCHRETRLTGILRWKEGHFSRVEEKEEQGVHTQHRSNNVHCLTIQSISKNAGGKRRERERKRSEPILLGFAGRKREIAIASSNFQMHLFYLDVNLSQISREFRGSSSSFVNRKSR